MVFFARLDIKLRDEEGPSFGTGVDCTPARRLSPAFSFAREKGPSNARAGARTYGQVLECSAKSATY